MHLCSNVLFGDLLPFGTIARRNFSFQPEEKGRFNRFYRHTTDRVLARRHAVADFFYSIQPLKPQARLQRIFSTAREHTVEVEVHPINEDEYQFLAGGTIVNQAVGCPILPRYTLG